MRVWFADNNYYDDHFDLTERHHLVGKAIAKFAEHGMKNLTGHQNVEDIRMSLRLLGYSLFQQWDYITEILQDNQSAKISKECMDFIQNYVANLPDKDKGESGNKDEAMAALEKLETVELDILGHLKEEISISVEQNEKALLDNQVKSYKKWIDDREKGLKEQYEMYLKESRLQQLEQRKRNWLSKRRGCSSSTITMT